MNAFHYYSERHALGASEFRKASGISSVFNKFSIEEEIRLVSPIAQPHFEYIDHTQMKSLDPNERNEKFNSLVQRSMLRATSSRPKKIVCAHTIRVQFSQIQFKFEISVVRKFTTVIRDIVVIVPNSQRHIKSLNSSLIRHNSSVSIDAFDFALLVV